MTDKITINRATVQQALDALDAWNGMFCECKYPDSEKSIEAAKQQGIYFTRSS